VKAPDVVVANLLFDLSNLVALTHTVEDAKRLLGMAKEYGYSPGWLLSIRQLTYSVLIMLRNGTPFALFICLVFVVAVIGLRRRKRA
jgi:hypothetical protein